MSEIFDTTPCLLGEGALWHPLRKTLFWFDILNKCLYERSLSAIKARQWKFNQCVSAAAWIDESQLLIASENALFSFDLDNQNKETIVALEVDSPMTRSNDGRADCYGGFWIGTMDKQAKKNAGAIYRLYKGELRKMFANITIPNSICFSPTGDKAYFCDTPKKIIMRVKLDNHGWPVDVPEIHIDLRKTDINSDGSVIDENGNLWNAQWGSRRVACYDQQGCFIQEQRFSASQISCPAFGGSDFSVLFATSAAEGLSNPKEENAGSVFMSNCIQTKGKAEYQFLLG